MKKRWPWENCPKKWVILDVEIRTENIRENSKRKKAKKQQIKKQKYKSRTKRK